MLCNVLLGFQFQIVLQKIHVFYESTFIIVESASSPTKDAVLSEESKP